MTESLDKPPDYLSPRRVEEILQQYEKGERYFAGSELDEATCDFQNVNLEGADFSFSFIVADFRGANLKGAKFTSANVKTGDFRNANLEGADFSGAALEGTAFEGANLRGTRFGGAGCFSYVMKEDEKPWW